VTDSVDVVVIGAGPAGLYTASQLVVAGLDIVVLEARDRVGGRLHSPVIGSARFDLGATWFWDNEPLVNQLVSDRSLTTFAQHLDGDMLFQTGAGVERIRGNQLDAPASRLVDGMQSIAESLLEEIPAEAVRLNDPVLSISPHEQSLAVEAKGSSWSTEHVVLAVPPATALNTIELGRSLPEQLRNLAAETPVWMGAATKIVAHYQRPFWRDSGLAGAAFSHLGPLREIHDMSGPGGDPAAIFGFAQPSAGAQPVTERDVLEQLEEIFGPYAARPIELLVADWRTEQFTSPPGVERLGEYQTYGHRLYQQPALDGRLHWASTETSVVAPGHTEGALAAASRAVGEILEGRSTVRSGS
jgi:monoamine oxidase